MTLTTPTAAPRRVVLTTFGSLGDLHPYMAIGLELRARGHDVLLATSAIYREKIEAAGLRFHPVRPDGGAIRADPELMRRIMDARRGGETVICELVMPRLRESYDDLTQACDGADVVVGHVLTYAARLVAETTGILWASSALQPIGFFSAFDPPVLPTGGFVRHLRFLGPAFHRGLFRLARRMVRKWSEPWHRLRAELGLPPTSDDPVFEGQHSPDLVLALFSPWLARKQRDWPASSVVTGFPFYDVDGEAGLPPDLARFLDAGPPPIVFTLGSSAVSDPGTFYEVGAAAAQRLGRRAVLLVGREPAALPVPLPDGVAAFAYAPYSQLFPRAAAIVHQGGVGTTGQAMRAGKPMLVMPYSHDQPDNAARVTRLGIARTLPRRKLSPARMVRELEWLLGDPACAARAAEVGAAESREEGARGAASAIEELCARRRGGGSS